MEPDLPVSEWLWSWPERARIGDLDQGPAIVADASLIGMTGHVTDHVVVDPDDHIGLNGLCQSTISALDAGTLRRSAECR